MDFETIATLVIGAFFGFIIGLVFMSNTVSYEKIKSGREFQMNQDLWRCSKTKELPYLLR